MFMLLQLAGVRLQCINLSPQFTFYTSPKTQGFKHVNDVIVLHRMLWTVCFVSLNYNAIEFTTVLAILLMG